MLLPVECNIVIMKGKVSHFLVVYFCWQNHCLYVIQLDILYNIEYLTKWMYQKYCLHKLGKSLFFHIHFQ